MISPAPFRGHMSNLPTMWPCDVSWHRTSRWAVLVIYVRSATRSARYSARVLLMGQSVVPIPAHIMPIWNHIPDETVEVHAYWKLFNQLFGVSQDQFDLLNQSAGFCFYAIEDAIGTDI